jgi:hypothetical protein
MIAGNDRANIFWVMFFFDCIHHAPIRNILAYFIRQNNWISQEVYKLCENTRDFSHGMNRSTVFGQSHD